MMKYFYLAAAVILFSGFYFVREPMAANFKDSAAYRWLNKTVLAKRPFDEMENLDNWRSFTSSGVQMVDSRKVIKTLDSSSSVATIELSKLFVHQGSTSMLVTTPTRLNGAAPKNGRG